MASHCRSQQQLWLGLNLPPLPYESAACALMRLAWRSVVTEFAMRKLCTGKAHPIKTDGFRDLRWLRSSLVFDQTGWLIPSDEEIAASKSLRSVSRIWLSSSFRFCPLCLEGAYHSFWFQFEPLACCPVHAIPLTILCASCRSNAVPYDLCKQIFHAPFRCNRCGEFLCGTQTTWRAHREFREHAQQLSLAFSELDTWAYRSSPRLRLLLRFARQNQTNLARQPIANATMQGMAYGLSGLPRICSSTRGCPSRALRWNLRLSISRAVCYQARSRWEERASVPLAVYRVVLRRLQRWLAPSSLAWPGKSPYTNEDEVRQLPVLQAAYCLFRFRVEGYWYSVFAPATKAWIRDAPVRLGPAGHGPLRLACAAQYVGMYMECIASVARKLSTGETLEPPFALQDGLELFALHGGADGHSVGAVIVPWVVELPYQVTGPVCGVPEVLEELARLQPHHEDFFPCVEPLGTAQGRST
jgi:hypothetical protein